MPPPRPEIPPRSQYAFASAVTVGLLVLLFSPACQHGVPPPLPSATVTGPKIPFALPPPPVVDLRLRPLDLHVDLNWLDLDDFMPPGAVRVGPVNRLAAELSPANVTRYPSVELCASPDGRYVLFHEGMKQTQRRNIFHWLMLLPKGASFPNTIFGTTAAFQTSWSADSRHFAITHYPGGNASEVFVVEVGDLERKPIMVTPLIEAHFAPHLVSVPLFLKAYRWTRDGRLVIRALARNGQEPYELFGCEAVVTFGPSDAEPRVDFLRGFIKPQ